jgi:uncharacterized protein (DUF305 family)
MRIGQGNLGEELITMKYQAVLLVAFATFLMACGSQPATNTASNNTSPANQAKVDHSTMDHSKMDHSTMDHSAMKSSPDAASADYDLQFIDTMIAHHQGAVDMAKMIPQKAESSELKALGKEIVTSQEKEIAEMKSWREKWFAGKPAAINMELRGMSDSMKGMDMKKLDGLTGKAFDIEFAKQMIPHHEGAVLMGREAIERSKRDEIKRLSNEIIKAQQAEIAKMNAWIKEWSK